MPLMLFASAVFVLLLFVLFCTYLLSHIAEESVCGVYSRCNQVGRAHVMDFFREPQ